MFQQYIDDGMLVPGWHKGVNFSLAGSAQHVSASTLHCLSPPGSLIKALCTKNLDRSIWLESYKEEYDGLVSNNTFDIISEDEYKQLLLQNGVKAIPSMCTFTVKKTNGVPTRAKSRIVALGNFDHRPWTKTFSRRVYSYGTLLNSFSGTQQTDNKTRRLQICLYSSYPS
jgi:hypothetical protein